MVTVSIAAKLRSHCCGKETWKPCKSVTPINSKAAAGIIRSAASRRLPIGAGRTTPVPEADRLAAVRALIREAEDYEADAIVGLDFELDSVDGVEIGGVPLRRVAATGLAVKFDEAA